MTKDELKSDFYSELRDRFKHTTDPYKDITGWALTDFIAEYLANKLAICSVSESYSILTTDIPNFRKELITMIEQVRYQTGRYNVGSSTEIAERFEHTVNSR